MKKLLSAALVLAMLLALTGCGLFSDASVVKMGDYTYNDPKDLKYDERTVLKSDSFGSMLEQYAEAAAYPDTMMYDDAGNVVGMYDYDASTGMAVGWTNLTDGTYTAFNAGEEVDLGMPDESLMLTLAGDVTLYCVVYGNQGKAVDNEMYFFLSDAADKDSVKTAVADSFGLNLNEESDTILTASQDADTINGEFDIMENDYGESYDARDAQSYAQLLMQNYGVREDMGENPYTPYEGHEDPTDVEFDERIVMTGSGQAAVDEDLASDISSQTDYVYGKDGKVVAYYSYFECPSKDAADKIEDFFATATGMTRVSDTVVRIGVSGQDMQDVLTAYKGYNVLKDDSVDDYVRMLEETYFTSVYER